MTSNDELLVFMKAHEQKIDKYFELTGQQFKIINERITAMYEKQDLLMMSIEKVNDDFFTFRDVRVSEMPEPIREDVDYEKKEPTAFHVPVKKKNVEKVSVNGKLPEGYKISGKGCKYCNGRVAWAPFIPDADLVPGQKRPGPLHCDENGNLKGDGRCPNL